MTATTLCSTCPRSVSGLLGLIGLLFVGAPLGAQAPAEGRAEPADRPPAAVVKAVTQEACDAVREGDVRTLERLLAPEFTLVSSSSHVQSREALLAEVRAGEPEYDVFRNRHMTAHVYDDAAVVQGITSLAGRAGGEPFELDVRFTDTLIRVDGQWTLVVSHVTRIPDP